MEEPQQLRQKKVITLIGRLETPIILPQPFIQKSGCWVQVVGDPITESKPLFTSVGKLVKDEYRVPTTLKGYRGYVKVTCVGVSEEKLRRKISPFLQKRFLGKLTSEGYGRVAWVECFIKDFEPIQKARYKKFRIRRGLGINYPPELQRLLIALMLHDFVHTERHKSKIFQQVIIEDEEIRTACLYHHNGTNLNNPYHQLLQYYDGLASYISRRKPFKTMYRYDKTLGEINFQQIVEEVEGIQQSAYKLYHYIYHSEPLSRVIESLEYGNNPLKTHLLLMVNLAINDYLSKRLIIEKGNIKIKNRKIISSSATNSEDAQVSVRDAEMHPFSTMSKADSESATNS